MAGGIGEVIITTREMARMTAATGTSETETAHSTITTERPLL